MGYSTDFRGSLNFDKPLTKDMVETYKKFANQRHEDGYQPNGKPSIWLQWEIVEQNGNYRLEWDGGEKFSEYIKWLEYIIKYIFNLICFFNFLSICRCLSCLSFNSIS